MTSITNDYFDLNGNEMVVASGGTITVQSGGTITAPAGAITVGGVAVTPLAAEKNTAIATVGAGTLTAAAIVGGVITRSGSTAAYTDTTDTAANIIAAMSNAAVGNSWELTLVNTVAFAQTLTAGTGVTLSGLSGPVPANSTCRFLCTYTGAGAVTMQAIAVFYNAANGYDPSTVQTQFGSSTGTFLEEGNIYRTVSGAGVNPGATGADNVLAVYSIPANAFDGVGNRGLAFQANGQFANNANTKRAKIIFNPATAVVGSTVGAGGTTIADTGSYNTAALSGFMLSAEVFKYGASNSNTQLGMCTGIVIAGSHSGIGAGAAGAPAAITATENATILVAVTGNAGTATTDIALNFFAVNAMN